MTPAAAVRAAIPRDVADLLRALRSAGFGAYVVGGAVRDVIVGRAPADWDLATEATPDQLRALFPNATYVCTTFKQFRNDFNCNSIYLSCTRCNSF